MSTDIDKYFANHTGFDHVRPAIGALAEIFEGCRHDIEFRALPSKKSRSKDPERGQMFLPLNGDGRHDWSKAVLPISTWQERGLNLYYGAGTREGGGRTENVREMPTVWLDFDGGDEKAFLDKLAKFKWPASLLVETSPGRYQVFWRLKTPATAEDIPKALSVVRGLAILFDGDPTVADAARILRVPGTVNMNHERPVQGRIVWFDGARRYDLTEMHAHAGVEALAKRDHAPRAASPARETSSFSSETQSAIDTLTTRCSFVQHFRDNAASLPEPDWYMGISNLVHLRPGGVDVIHAWSSPYPGYTRGETDAKILKALNASAPITCAKIGERWKGCAECPSKGAVTAPINLVYKFAGRPMPAVEVVETKDKAGKTPETEIFGNLSDETVTPTSGLVAQYIQHVSPLTDAPRRYHLAMAWLLLSILLGPACALPHFGSLLFANLWIILIGPSSRVRKTTALSFPQRIVARLEPDRILPAEFTTERLFEVLANQPVGGWFFSEFKSMADMVSRDYNAGAKALLTDLYDVPPVAKTRSTKGGGDITIPHPCYVTIASATTPEWLLNRKSADDFASGFLPRFVFVPVLAPDKEPMAFCDDQNLKGYTSLLAEISNTLSKYKTGGTLLAGYTPEAKEAFKTWFIAIDKSDPLRGTPLIAFTSRYQAIAHKIAMLYTVSVGRDVGAMDVEAVRYGTKYVSLSRGFEYSPFVGFENSPPVVHSFGSCR